MAELNSNPPRTRHIVVDPEGDLQVEVHAYGGGEICTMKVSRDVLLCCPGTSEYFRRSLHFNEANNLPSDVIFKDDNVDAMIIWLSWVHYDRTSTLLQIYGVRPFMAPLTRLVNTLRDHGVHMQPVECIWEVLNVANKYRFEHSSLKEFFRFWYRDHLLDLSVQSAQAMVLPCFAFDFPGPFFDFTRWLAYNTTDQDFNLSPPGFEHIFTAAREHITYLLTEFRKTLRNGVRQIMWDRVAYSEHWIHSQCKRANGIHQRSIGSVNSFKFGTFDWSDKSVVDLFRGLENLPTFLNAGDCTRCDGYWKRIVDTTPMRELQDWDGLCLDCMKNAGSNRMENVYSFLLDDPYDGRGSKSIRCRVGHQLTAWHHSTRTPIPQVPDWRI